MAGGQDNADLFLRVFSESKAARDDLTGLIARLRELDKEGAKPEIDVGVTKAQAKIKKLASELFLLGSTRNTTELNVDTKKAEGQIALFSAHLASLTDPQSKELHAAAQFDSGEAGVQIELFKTRYRNLGKFTGYADFDTRKAKNEIFSLLHQAKRIPAEFKDASGAFTLFSDSVGKLTQKDIKINVDVTDHGQLSLLQRGFEALQPSIKKDADQLHLFAEQLQIFGSEIASTRATHGVEFRVNDNLPTESAKLAIFSAELDALSHQTAHPNVDLNVGEAQLKFALVNTQLDLLDRKKVDVKVTSNWGLLTRLGFAVAATFQSGAAAAKTFVKDIDSVGSAASAVGGLLSGAVSGAQELASSLFSLGSAGGGAGKGLAGVSTNIGPFGAALTGTVIIVLILVAAIAVSLVGALAALAASAIFAAGAIAALLTALVALAGPIAAVLIPAFLALTQIYKVLMKRQQEAANAELKKAQADQDAVQAARAHADAEQALTDALRSQARTAKDSAASVRDAQAGQREAVANLRDATVKAYQEMRDAVERYKDSQLSLERANLSKDQAVLGVKQATAALAAFRKQTNTVGNSLDGLFQKFTNVDFKGNAAAIKGALSASGVNLKPDQELQLEQLVLNVRDARLREKEATDGVHDAQTALTDAQITNNKFFRDGIKASDTYQTALKGVAAAQKQVAATALTAKRARQDAARAVAGAKQGITRNTEDRAAKLRQDDLTKSQQLTDNLSSSQQNLLTAVTNVWAIMKKAFGPAVAAVLDGITKGIGTITPAIGGLRDPLTKVGKAIGSSIGLLATLLTSPAVQKGFATFSSGAATLAPLITQVFGGLFLILMQVAQTAMPFLLSAFQSFSDLLTGLGGNQSFMQGLSDFVAGLMPHLQTWWDLAVQIGRAMFYLLVVLAPFGLALAQWIGDAAKHFAEWANSDDGRRQIQEFLATAIPLAKSFAGFVRSIVGFFIRLTEVIGPFIGPVLNGLTTLLDLVNGLLRPLGLLAKGIAAPFAAAVSLADKIIGVFTTLVNKATTYGSKFVEGLIKGMVDWIPKAVSAVKDLGGKVLGAIKGKLGIHSPSRAMMDVGVNVGRGLEQGLDRGAKRLARVASQALAVPVLQAAPAVGPALAATASSRAGTYIANQQVNLPPAQGGGMGDPRHEAAMFALEMKRRGGGPV